MNCCECEELLQAFLDGAPVPSVPELGVHLEQCPRCRELHQAGLQLVHGLQKLPLLEPSQRLTERIVTAVRAERRQRILYRQRWLTATAAVVALVLLPLAASLLPRPTDTAPKEMAHHPPAVPQQPKAVAEPSLHEQVEEARLAMTSLTSRLAEQTREQARVLWEAAPPVEIPPVGALPGMEDLEPPLHPAAESLQKAKDGVSVGLQTVASSAQRAVSFFVREIPALPN
jgi:hypothetical protein